ncbi:MAG TPA: cation-translocating P-type ATPase [Methylotenera sp.]|nr:cation-translocating P-type ATPase [Methylotenera sp.]
MLADAYITEHLTRPEIAETGTSATAKSWTILDTEEQWQSFSQPLANNSTEPLVQSNLLLEGLRCAACSSIIERGLLAQSGVMSARVSMSKSRAVVVWSPIRTRPSEILNTIHTLGYSATPANHGRNEVAALKQQRTAFWRWMVAGFCMMQVMMYATPSYFVHVGDMTDEARHLLNWASWILSLPVILFSSSAFFSQAFRDLKSGQISMDLPVALGIAITFIVSSAATFEPNSWWGNTVYFDSLTMFVFFLLSARLIEAKLHHKTLGALENLVSRIPESIERLNSDGSFSRILNGQLKVGDTVRVHLGEAFPADGTLVMGHTSVDESLLTGEATPIAKHQYDQVIAGSYNLGTAVHMHIETLGESTKYGQIVNLINQAAIEKPRLSQIADRIARPFLLFVILTAGLAAAMLWNVDRGHALMTAAAVLIVTCPCALSLATPAAMLASASAFVKRGILISRLQAIESIANIDTVIFDKTGTLTEDNIQVTDIQCKAGFAASDAIGIAQALAKHSMHPVSRALISHTSTGSHTSNNVATITLTNVSEEVGAGLSGTLVNANSFVQLGSAKFCGIEPAQSPLQQVYLADTNGWLATFTLQESLKANTAQTIQQLKDLSLTTELLSGDQLQTVTRAAETIGITQFQAACSPQDKLSRLQALKQAGKKVLMVGDGLNDGPILASAHASIAMGKGVPLSQAHADYILLNGDISQIPQLISHARKTMQVIKQNIAWAIVYNVVCIPLAFVGVLSPWMAGLGMAVSSIIVVLNALRLTQFSTSNIKVAA